MKTAGDAAALTAFQGQLIFPRLGWGHPHEGVLIDSVRGTQANTIFFDNLAAKSFPRRELGGRLGGLLGGVLRHFATVWHGDIQLATGLKSLEGCMPNC